MADQKSGQVFNRIDIAHLSDILLHCLLRKVPGVFYQGIDFKLISSHNTKFSGNLILDNGYFINSRFQSWLATALQMPSLNDVSSAGMSCHFKIEGKTKMLDDLKLKTDDLDLSGFFHLDADDLVSAQSSVRLSKKLLSESPIGRSVIGLVHAKAWELPFEFSLSGNLYRMNFQWDDSALKNKVHRHLFSFFERMIDRRMDDRPNYKVTIPSESVSPVDHNLNMQRESLSHG